MSERPSAEWLAKAATEPYRIGSRVRDGRDTAWFVYDVWTDEQVGRALKSREAALRKADLLNAARLDGAS